MMHTRILAALVFVMTCGVHRAVGAAPPPAPVEAAAASPSRTLTAAVTSIASAGVPGPLAVFGEHAFVIVSGKEDKSSRLPVVAGATWERGRVVAFGHGGMIGSEALLHDGTEALVLNAVRWLKADRPGPVGVVGNDAMVRLLNASGIEARAKKEPWHGAINEYATIIADAHGFSAEERGALKSYITGGGGLLTAGLGWGWLQLSPGKTIHEHPGNLLLRECGLAWCDGMLETDTPKAFSVTPGGELLHALRAMDAIEGAAGAAANVESRLDAQAATTMTAAVRVLEMRHPLMQRATALLQARRESVTASQDRPLTKKQGVARMLMALQVEIEKRTPAEKITAHTSASGFPGSVPADAPRVERTIAINLGVPGWHSTGLYALPGEVISVRWDAPVKNASVRIGCHTDHLWHHDKWQRVPDVSRSFPLSAGETKVASAFGGLVYIEVPKATKGSASVVVRGAVESPRYVLGTTTREEWLRVRSAPGAWGELETRKVIVSVPSEVLRTLDDPAPVLEMWDKISDAHATLATIPLVPEKPHRYVADIQISAGYMHSGYPIMTHLDAADDMVTLEKLSRGSWGLLHELGHNHQEGEWTFEGTGEVTCNLFALHAIDTVCMPKAGERGHPGVNQPPSLKKYLDKGAPFEEWKRDPFLALHMYVQMEKAFGWETFKKVFAEYRALPRGERPKNDDEKRDQWMVRFSKACGKNLGPFFEAWGVPTSAAARAEIAGLPGWMPEGWGK